MVKMSHHFTWHIRFWWSVRHFKVPFERNAFYDGGSVEWRAGPVIVEKRIHWRDVTDAE